MSGHNLLSTPPAGAPGPQPTYLPDDHPDADVVRELEAGEEALDLAAKYPASCLAWAVLADEAYDEGRQVDSYAYARVGYHRGLDALRAAGWRGAGPIPWSHKLNRGFLRALFALGRAASAIGEGEEAARVDKFLRESDPDAVRALDQG
ncbi:DUF3151 domain-containing protein [Spelaeicoccus albus]|uniref:DUF3151 domain-containing protein n=1 Tax=Spelaeicoccus albus TaxID=1280376 RepID=A0A7Z0AA42_9MICO|nr:DUF3151 domain-containing protein [Spelaeicoccus albus]NYI66155.1 hypothetical protein [Spelaeicoccus albus]